MPDISIVIVAHDSGPLIVPTLKSVQQQTEAGWECSIVDNGTRDNAAVVAPFWMTRVFEYRRHSDGRVSTSRNFGAEHSDPRSPWLIFMDHDDIWLPHALAGLRRRLEAHDNVVGAHGLAELIDQDGHLIPGSDFVTFGRRRWSFEAGRYRLLTVEEPTTFAALLNTFTMYPIGAVMLRRSAFVAAGGFDPCFRSGGEDWDLFSRMSRSGDFAFVDDVVIQYRRHASNGSNRAREMHRLGHLVRHRIFFSPDNTPTQAALVRRAYPDFQRLRIGEKLVLFRQEYRAGHYGRAFRRLLEVVALGLRWLRGYPTLAG